MTEQQHEAPDTASERVQDTRAEKPRSAIDRDRPFLLCAGAIFLLVMTWQYVSRVTSRPSLLPWKPVQGIAIFQVDINSGNWVELSQLDGIGPALAHRIVAYRESHGRFESVDALREVPGIGPTTVAKLRRNAVVRPALRKDKNSEQL